MSTRKVIKNFEAAIDRVCEDIKEKKVARALTSWTP